MTDRAPSDDELAAADLQMGVQEWQRVPDSDGAAASEDTSHHDIRRKPLRLMAAGDGAVSDLISACGHGLRVAFAAPEGGTALRMARWIARWGSVTILGLCFVLLIELLLVLVIEAIPIGASSAAASASLNPGDWWGHIRHSFTADLKLLAVMPPLGLTIAGTLIRRRIKRKRDRH